MSVKQYRLSTKYSRNRRYKIPEFNTKKIRELIHDPFQIIYLREEKSIRIIRIWRSERILKLQNTPAEKEI